MKNMLILFVLILQFILQSGCNNKSREVENIQTFSKVYGYVRWFYPGDEASQVDWNRFAIYGASKVTNARNQRELKSSLIELFKPIAPAIQIEDSSDSENYNLQSIIPSDLTDFKPVFWKHYGVYLSDRSNIYQSIRINRSTANDRNFCLMKYLPDISNYRGKEVKMIVSMKTNSKAGGKVSLCLTSIENLGLDIYNTFRKSNNTIKPTDQWTDFEMSVKINQKDSFILLGLDIDGLEQLSIADIKLMELENKTWKPIKIFNSDLNSSGWQKNKFLFNYNIDSSQKKNGKDVIEITTLAQDPKIGDLVRKNIGNNLVFTMPLVLYGTDRYTYPIPDTIELRKLNQQLSSIPNSDLSTKNLWARLANVVIAWNVLQHFYPYFDVVNVDWEKVLPLSLNDVYTGKTEPDYYKTLCRMIAKLEDGHGVVYATNLPQWGLPVSYAWIENQVVITGSKTELFKRGDIIKSIDGISALEELIRQESLVSGSPQLKRYRALNMFGTDFSKTEANITLIRDNKTLKLIAKRELQSNLFFNPFGMSSLKSGKYSDGIYYLNSKRADFEKELSDLVNAKGIIVASFSDYLKLIPHIIKEPVWSPIWDTPITTRPDRENVVFDSSRWKIEPQKPFLNAKLVFIEEPFRVSAGETYLSFIDHYKLGKLVGDTTAGTNGNANFIPLMGGYSIMWTGMKVLRQDGSQHHLIGFRPDYPVKRTIEAIKENRNEYLEKALEILKN